MKKWKKLDTGETCPKCGGELEMLVDYGQEYPASVKERCVKGCYVFNFETMTRER